MRLHNFFAGGLLAAALASPVIGQWQTDNLSLQRYGIGAITHDGKAFFAGGDACCPTAMQTRVDVYDPNANPPWSQADLSVPRFEIRAASVGSYALFAGGAQHESGGLPVDTVDIYDSSLGAPDDPAAWSTHTLFQARTVGGAATVGSKVLFAGGAVDGGANPSNVVDVYDSALGPPTDPGAWSVTTLTSSRSQIAATTVGTKAFFAGGGGGSSPTTYNTVDIYDDATGTWSTENLLVARMGAATVTVGDKALFAGGLLPGFNDSAAVDIYDASTDTWSGASLSLSRQWLAAAVAGDRYALFVGGQGSGQAGQQRVDIYDAVTGSWSTETLLPGRFLHSGVTLGDQAIFAGGWVNEPNGTVTDQVVIIGPSLEDCQVSNYCVSTPNSVGVQVTIGATGLPYFQHNDLALTASGTPPNALGIFYYGSRAAYELFGSGIRCVGSPSVRLYPPVMADSQGSVVLPLDLTQPPFDAGQGLILPGDTRFFQYWYRDPGAFGGFGFNLSTGLEVTFCE